MWPQNNNPTWPANPSDNPTWPGSGSGDGGVWPGGNQGPPAWPSQPSQPGGSGPAPASSWPSQPGGSGPAPASSWPSQPGANQQSVAVPYTHSLNGVHNKLMIIINGVIKAKPNMFTVDMYAGEDVAFHFNPRFNERGQKVIVRNSCIRGKWGAEERELANFPFSPGQSFEMKILCTNGEFKVAVNGSHLLEFKHRLKNLNSIRSFGIFNDVTLTSVRTETLP
ncbi:galectin-5-like isoform X2 [Solea senegalensis]|uniref:Galectin n=1 Tax=Solea senegalensis TaxID=28829 RepID=A0AAV6PGJ8_SOLSE|nr:galectin-3b [Solea senegalensis]KAG7464345.1 galectin-5-like isoform X2 [Solea senegalensis]